jgi:hypothetical protein
MTVAKPNVNRPYKYPDTRTWVPEAEEALLGWVLRGEAFATNGPSIEPPNAAPADKQPRCKILAPVAVTCSQD